MLLKSVRWGFVISFVVLSFLAHAFASEDKKVILIFGDSGTGSRAQYAVGQTMYDVCQNKGCDFALMLGDNFYSSGVDSPFDKKFETHFERPYARFGRFDFWAVAGNHDWRSSVRAQIEYSHFSDRWRMPFYHYSVPGLPDWLHIYGLDTEQMNRAQDALARRALCDKKGWKFLFGHHPVYSSGKHGDSKKMAKRLLPIIKDCGVQAYFAGHDHHQEHISTPDFEQFIQGAAAKLRWVDPKFPEEDGYGQRFALSELGFAIAEVTPARLVVRFYSVNGFELYHWSADAPNQD